MSDRDRSAQKFMDNRLSYVWGKNAQRSEATVSEFGYRISEVTQERRQRVEADAKAIRNRLFLEE